MSITKKVKEFLEKEYDTVLTHIEFIKDNKKEILEAAVKRELKESEFYKATSILSPQMRSPLWEKYFIQKNNAEKVPSKEGRCDLLLNKKQYEYKVSGFNADNAMHLVQLREHHDCDYICEYVTKKGKKYTFELSKKQMKKEADTLGSSAHGTKKHIQHNKTKEKRMTIKYGSENWKRWIKNYIVNK